MPHRVELHPESVAEAEEAAAWYRRRSPRAAGAFGRELERAVALIAETPDRWPVYLEGTRRILLWRFPYLVVYRVESARVLVVAHGRRRPGYWRHRV